MMSEDHLAIAQQLEGILSRYTETLEASGDAGRVAWMLKGMLGRLLGSDVEALLEMFRTKNPNDPVVGAMNLMVEMRNEHAMRVLKHELRRRHRSFAVFYGAAHMGYFEEQLQKMGFEPMGVCWLTAWTVQLRGVEQPP